MKGKGLGNIFTQALMARPETSRFDLAHDFQFSGQMGKLMPTLVLECIPGDVHELSHATMVRMAPMIAPIMHRLNVHHHFFFVPNRILWSEWESWITGETDVNPPVIPLGGQNILPSSLGNYMGLPKGTFPDMKVNALPFAAYTKIWDEFYRDQNLQAEKFKPLVAGNNTGDYIDLVIGPPFLRAWEHDYFTSCLPFTQKGDIVQVPLTSEANIPVELFTNGIYTGVFKDKDGNAIANGDVSQFVGNPPYAQSVNVGTTPAAYDPRGSLVVDIQQDAVDINTFRKALRLQEFLERDARGGTRYIENILAHFGVKSSDQRLQRPEYICGSSQTVTISEVLATAENTEAVVPVGNMAGHGISVNGSDSTRYRVEEHGWIIGIMSCRPRTSYMNGLHRMFTRHTRLDYAWPTFAHLGEQAVFNYEVYANNTDPEQLRGTFGYQSRYAEYKYMNSRVAGDFADNLDFWHLGRKFDTPPALNSDFIECIPSNRIFAVQESLNDHLWIYCMLNIQSKRPLPKHGIPMT